MAVVDVSKLKLGQTVNTTGSGTVTNTVSVTDNVGDYYNKYGGQTTPDNLAAINILTGTSGFDEKNYEVTYHTKYTVTPAPLTIIADSKSMYQGEAVPPLTSTYHGFKNSDSPSSIADRDLFTPGTSSSLPGGYTIDFSGHPTNSNYVITLVPGTLLIQSVPTDTDVHNPPTQPTPVVPTVPKVQEPITQEEAKPVNDQGWGLDRIRTKASMPVYLVTEKGMTREGAYDVSEDATGVKMHTTLNTVSDPQDDITEHRSTTAQYTQNNTTGTFDVVFDGSIVKMTPQDDNARQMIVDNEGTRYISLFRGGLNTTLNNMGVVLESIKAVYLVAK